MKIFVNFAGSVLYCRGKGERLGYERPGFDPGLQSSFFLIETLSITDQKFSKCLKNGSDRLRKGQLSQHSFDPVQKPHR